MAEFNQTDMGFADDWSVEKYLKFMQWVASKHWDQIEEVYESLAECYEQEEEKVEMKTIPWVKANEKLIDFTMTQEQWEAQHVEHVDSEDEEQHASHYLVYGSTKTDDGNGMINDEEYIAKTLEEAKKEYIKLCEDGYDFVYLDSMTWEDNEWCQDCVQCSTLISSGVREEQ
tara:strand:+ start:188 stop:703 length:516 start_codon:yes stop_codon:yes gene_type:complete